MSTTDQDKEENGKETTVRLDSANEISVEATITVVLLQLRDIFTVKEEVLPSGLW